MDPCCVASNVTTDEIYERYLRKAITEINRLSHEIAQAADGAPTALPTGHPLASIFLLKFGPQAQELQEGVAFHGRAGSALIKSLQRLHVDAMEFLNGVDFQLSAPLRPDLGELQRFSPTIEGLYVPDIDLSLDEGPAKT